MAMCFALFAALAGCGRQSPNVAPSNVPQAQPSQAGADVKAIESRLAASEVPKSPEALKDEFVRRFDEDNFGAFRDLCCWDGVPEDVRRKNMEIFMIGIGTGTHRHHVTSARIEPCSPDQFETRFRNIDFPASPNLSPTHVLRVETLWKGGEDEESDTSGSYPVGTKDGGYYLCVGVLPK
jgi:predicted small lipoprotein YifL